MFCAMATVIDRCKTEGVVDVFQVVKALRIQRPGAVPAVVSWDYIETSNKGHSESGQTSLYKGWVPIKRVHLFSGFLILAE